MTDALPPALVGALYAALIDAKVVRRSALFTAMREPDAPEATAMVAAIEPVVAEAIAAAEHRGPEAGASLPSSDPALTSPAGTADAPDAGGDLRAWLDDSMTRNAPARTDPMMTPDMKAYWSGYYQALSDTRHRSTMSMSNWQTKAASTG